MDFGQKIIAICKEERITFKEFSDLCGIPEDTIKKYRQGKRSPSWEQINKIANTIQFEKYKPFLLSPTSTDPDIGAKLDQLTEDEAEIMESFRSSDPTQRRAILEFAQKLLAQQERP